MKTDLIKFHPSWIVTFLLLMLMSLWVLGGMHKDVHVAPIPTLINSSIDCKTQVPGNPEDFFIYLPGEDNARRLNTYFCENAAVNRQFGLVTSHWGMNDLNTMRIVGRGIADLALVKENIITALMAETTHGYTKIAHYPSYQAYFIGRNEKPVITKEYLMDKTFGLVSYPTSRSAHMIPKMALKELGLSIDKMSVIYAPSHEELRELLAAGQVDIISSYWQHEDQMRFSENYITPVATDVSGSAWYFKMAKRNNDVVCAAQKLLLQNAKYENFNYYQQLELVEAFNCNTQQADNQGVKGQ